MPYMYWNRFLMVAAKKFCFSVKAKENILYLGIVIFWQGGKNCIKKNEKWNIFPGSWYINSNPLYIHRSVNFNRFLKRKMFGFVKYHLANIFFFLTCYLETHIIWCMRSRIHLYIYLVSIVFFPNKSCIKH